jgi:hypothetical protein
MSNKVVEIVQDGSYRAGQPAQVQIVEGATIEFSNGADGGTELVLTPETQSILSPSPGSVVRIAARGTVSFTFKHASQNSYCCQVLAEAEEPRPINCTSSGAGAVLSILSSDDRGGDSRTGRGL